MSIARKLHSGEELWNASRDDNLYTVWRYYQLGADVEWRDEIGWTPLNNLDVKLTERAGNTMSIAKTKAQHSKKRPYVSCITKSDVSNFSAGKNFKFLCNKCSMTYPTNHGLSVHKG